MKCGDLSGLEPHNHGGIEFLARIVNEPVFLKQEVN